MSAGLSAELLTARDPWPRMPCRMRLDASAASGPSFGSPGELPHCYKTRRRKPHGSCHIPLGADYQRGINWFLMFTTCVTAWASGNLALPQANDANAHDIANGAWAAARLWAQDKETRCETSKFRGIERNRQARNKTDDNVNHQNVDWRISEGNIARRWIGLTIRSEAAPVQHCN